MRSPIVFLCLGLALAVSSTPCLAVQPAAKTPRLTIIPPGAFHPSLADYVAHKKKQLPVEPHSFDQGMRAILLGDSTLHREGVHQERAGDAEDRAKLHEDMAQAERTEAATERSQQDRL